MHVEPYRPELFDELARAARGFEQGNSLVHRPFVDAYYTAQPWCQLFLARDSEGVVLATQGVEMMPFTIDGRHEVLGFGSNFYSSRPGIGALLFLRCLESCPTAIVFGGSESSHAIMRRRGWRYFEGPRTYVLNHSYDVATGEPSWRRLAKWGMRLAFRRRLATFVRRVPTAVQRRLWVREEEDYSSDMLPSTSRFRLRFTPTVEYLRWRYNLHLDMIRYRLFRILAQDRTVGYVVLSDAPDQLVIAHADGEDPTDLAYGMILSVLGAAEGDSLPRSVLAVTANPAMQRVLELVGFRASRQKRPLAMGGQGAALANIPDPADWLVSFGWGDNGLRMPFRDRQVAR